MDDRHHPPHQEDQLKPGALGAVGITSMVVAAAAPLTIMAGVAPLAIAIGGIGAPAGYLAAAVVLALFAVGFTTMTRHTRGAGAFYSYITLGLGRSAGAGAGLLAVLAYNALQIGVYGLLGTQFRAAFLRFTGVDVPWWVFALLGVALVFSLGRRGVDVGAKLLGVLLAAETLVLVLLVVAVLARGGHDGLSLTSFTPAALTQPGMLGILGFCFAAFMGFESTALYRGEARDPERSIPRATYLAVAFLGLFYGLVAWAIVQAFGDADVVAAAAADPAGLFFTAMDTYVGPWASDVMAVLVLTSVLASQIAFHNAINRYAFSLAHDGLLPASLGAAHPRFASPARAGAAQSVLAAVVVGAFALAGADPYYQLVLLVNTPGAVGVVLLQALTAISVVVYLLRRNRTHGGNGVPIAASALATALLALALFLLVRHVDLLTGAGTATNVVLVGAVPVVLLLGIALARVLRVRRPEVFARIGGDDVRRLDAETSPTPTPEGRPVNSTADLLLLADTVHTLDPSNPLVQAVAVVGGTVTAVGSRADARDWRGAGTQVLDLGPATVTPGLVDGHVHPVMGLDLTVGTDLSGVRDLDDLDSALRGAASGLGRGRWLRGWGLDPNAFGAAAVTSEPLVRALGPDVPVFLDLFDAHSALVSPRALEIAGVCGPREFSSGASVVCGADGRPTGHLLEMEAVALVRGVLPRESPQRRRERLRELLQRMAAVGITAGNAMDFEGDSHDLVRALEEDGELPVRWRFAPFVMPGASAADLDHVVGQQRLRGRRWEVDGAKFMIDGTVDGGTAWLEEPDTHGESTAPFWPDPQEYVHAVRHLAGHGVPTVTHAIGDAGIRHVLRTLADAPRRSRVPHRVEHLETMPADLLPLFRRLDVTASVQPTHCTHYTRADQSDNWSQRLGRARADRAFRTRDLVEAGARLALGSDWPVAPFDPRAIIADAQLRRTAGRPEEEPVLPAQGLTARAALAGFTTQAAAAAGLADRAGVLRPGFRADLSAFTLDPLAADPDEFAQSPVELTVVAGEIVHR